MRCRHATALVLLVLGAAILVACAVNPATGRRQLVLIPESQEIAIGQENDKAIVASMGLVQDEKLQRYIQELGSGMAATSERPDLDWTFRLVDDPVVNAFALPGGFIYITRGIMAHLNSEAELAGVLGHEIGHVTGRHGVNQMSKQQLATLGLGIGMVLSEDFREYGNLAMQGLGLLFLKYSRDAERQADDLGLRYVVRDGFDPRPMAEVYTMLERVSQAGGGGAVPALYSTHPDPGNRRERILEGIAQLPEQSFGDRTVNHDRYLDLLDGLTFGPNPREGYFKDGTFFHPDMKFRMEFPAGWNTVNQRQAVVGISPQKNAIVQLTLASGDSAGAAMQAFMEQQGVQPLAGWVDRIGGYGTASGYFSAQTQDGVMRGLVAFVGFGDTMLQLLGYTPEASWTVYQESFTRSLGSFADLTDRAALSVEPKRLRIVRAERSMSLEEFARRNGASVEVGTLALINQMPDGGRVQFGQRYKVVVGGELP